MDTEQQSIPINAQRSKRGSWLSLRHIAPVSAAALLVVGLGACGTASSGGGSPTSAAQTSAAAVGGGTGQSSSGTSVAAPVAGAAPTGSPLVVADLAPFTGADAALGPTYLASCYAATGVINQNGGVLGHPLTCKQADTRGDPADAVPATRQMFASTSGLALVIGVTSDEAASVVPIINSNKTVVFAMTGQSEFDNTHFDYFYRLVPPDLEESYAMVVIAQKQGYHKIALAFGNDIGSQTFVQPAISAIQKAGMKLVANETLDLTATTFRTEAEKIVSAHPDVIFTEALGSTEAAFLSEVKSLNGGKMIPIIGTSATISPAWYQSVAAAVGAGTLSKNFLADNLVVETSGPAYTAFKSAMDAIKGKVGNSGNFDTYLTAPGGVHLYDGINLSALGMIKSKSTDPTVWKAAMEKIANGVPGAVVVNSFAQGLKELKAGKDIRYEGPGGPTNFDSYHDSTGIFQINTYDSSGNVKVTGNLTAQELRAVS